MITHLTTIADDLGDAVGDELTVRCRIRSEPLPGETAGEKTVYRVDDPYGKLHDDVFLSFWTGEPTAHDALDRTAPYVISTLGIPTGDALENGTHDGGSLQRGEEVIVRAVPNRRSGDGAVYLNVTSFVVRSPEKLISKSKLRTQDRCPREYYLRYVKQVYPGDRFETNPGRMENRFRGDALHTITETALEDTPERFRTGSWDEAAIEELCESVFADEFGFRQALLVLSGVGLDVREQIVEAVTTLFTDQEFCDRISEAAQIEVEQFLSNDFGYAGRVDIILDGVPLDLKTTRNPSEDLIERHGRQIKLYLFALLLERIDAGESFRDAVAAGQSGTLVYPNTPDDGVRFESVELTMDDVQAFLETRNAVIETGEAYAPPSTYNRECEGCAFANEEWVSGPSDTLPPACTYHCQNERRWPCYETDGGELTSQCSLFDSCDQRTQYREPDTIDHYESVRVAFREEESARKTARRVVDKLDDDVLADAGYLLPALSCVGAAAAGTIVRFASEEPIVPAFDPGDIVDLRIPTEDVGGRAVYYGTDDGEYLFSPLDRSLGLGDFLTSDAPAQAQYTFSVESVQDRYLPYLDFAQRRNGGDPIHRTRSDDTDMSVPETVAPDDVPSYLDHEQVFVDLPVRTDRTTTVATLVNELVSADYPDLDAGDSMVPSEDCRTLVLCTRPDLAEAAVQGQPSGNHYRLDGTGGEAAIQNDDGYHEIQSRLKDARSIVSTVQQATSTAGPGGIREFFHKLPSVPFIDRDHTENFFDAVVLLGAERLTEPEHDFLADISDRTVAIGDSRRSGPTLLSQSATDASLDTHFETAFERYRSFPTDEAVSLQLRGEAPPALRQFYQEGPWDTVDGDLSFLNVRGDEETAVEDITLESTVPAATGTAQRLVFDVTDTPLSPMAANELFENRIELDATNLRAGSVVVLDDESLYLRSKEPIEGSGTSHHQVVIETEAAELAQFSRALLSNRIAEQIVAEVVEQEEPDVVVTPFERHATGIKRHLADRGLDVPVERPESLTGSIADHAVVSFATANEHGIVRPPLDEPSVLYGLLSSGADITFVGNDTTLESKDVFSNLIDASSEY